MQSPEHEWRTVELSTGARVSLIAHTAFESMDVLAEYAARICYRSTQKLGRSPNFIQQRIKDGHESVIEHATATFLIDGISRACAQELTRYRLASYSMESQRYVDYSSMIDALAKHQNARDMIVHTMCVVPEAADDLFIEGLCNSITEYRMARNRGMKKEDARYILPLSVRTKLAMTTNMREYRHVVKQRTHPSAHWEIRELANAMLHLLKLVAPKTFADLEEQ